jgi:RNA polymerase sigma factor (sigma-70 family)
MLDTAAVSQSLTMDPPDALLLGTLTDQQLLQRYTQEGCEDAFTELVRRYLYLVQSTANHTLGDRCLAEEASQSVFIILARKAGTLSSRVILSGWLYRATRYAAANMMKTEQRRREKEEEIVRMQELTTLPSVESCDPATDQITGALAQLGDKDRAAIVLRFFQQKTLREIGDALGSTEEAAKKRVTRAVGRIKMHLATCGCAMTTVAIGTALSERALLANSTVLAEKMAQTALCKGPAPCDPATILLAERTIRSLAWGKAQLWSFGAILFLSLTLGTALFWREYFNATPAATVRLMNDALRRGDGRRFVRCLELPAGNEDEARSVMEKCVEAQGGYRSAILQVFGPNIVIGPLPFDEIPLNKVAVSRGGNDESFSLNDGAAFIFRKVGSGWRWRLFALAQYRSVPETLDVFRLKTQALREVALEVEAHKYQNAGDAYDSYRRRVWK